MARVVSIVGSPTTTSRTTIMTRYLEKQLTERGIEVETIYVRDLPPEDLLHVNFNSEPLKESHAKVAEADGVIVASPVYKASYTGILKTYLDLLPQDGLRGKAVLPLMTGGTFGHLLAIDYGLKPVLNSLGARHVLGGVYSLDTQLNWTDNEKYEIDEEIEVRLSNALHDLVMAISK
ncbi:NADPH-dependent FMN reductase [Halalkalibacterium ligniniphilum]|uniref:NADPH-dependent FMN reductase n=1 Tax=Halalkalibacterium ligniniphilum TaxID=1134413 RepID=UPI00034909B9|nr:NADPH-dependent FMN reductase [Halalkalibacterium ligniniphilum]